MRVALSTLFIFLASVLAAQKIQTVVPSQPIVIGTAFQVQYIIIEPSGFAGAETPEFENFLLVSGPNHYKGKAIIEGRMQVIENITYTLVPQKTGILIIPALHAGFKDGNVMKSENEAVTVIPKPKMSFLSRSSYTDVSLYAPSSHGDLDRMINENIFIRAEVSKKTCYVGEAITASFKLYSRLQSSSELVRVPSLYGFSVIDILDIRESHQAVETINGKIFNTSILREVQLYPEQSGQLVIDEMVVNNEIEFDDSLDNDKKTVIEKELRSKPIVVRVKAIPLNKPDSFNGAVGQFRVSAVADQKNLRVNEQGKFRLVISGRGNFIQLGEPLIIWPEGLNVFEPVIENELNTAMVPTQGKKIFTYGFVSDSAGSFIIPPVNISYFDPEADSFKMISTQAIELNVEPAKIEVEDEIEKQVKDRSLSIWLVAALILLTFGIWYFRFNRKQKKEMVPAETSTPAISMLSKLESLDIENITGRQACIEITKILNELLKSHTDISPAQLNELHSIKNDCQLMAYSNIEAEVKKQALKARTGKLVREMEA